MDVSSHADKLKLGGQNYRDAAIHYADVLCNNFRDPDATDPEARLNERQSPWPFRVHAQTNMVKEEYSAAILGPIKLLDDLIRLGLGNITMYRRTREKAWAWMMQGPMVDMLWCAYFEDIVSFGAAGDARGCGQGNAVPPVSERGNWHQEKILPINSTWPRGLIEPVPDFMTKYVQRNSTTGALTWETCNINNYSPLETVRYLMSEPGGVDPTWRQHAETVLEFVKWTLVDNRLGESPNHPGVTREGNQWGARVVSEQFADSNRMVSHTSRYASVLALLAERTANHSLGAIARRSWDWASYMCDARGRVVVGPVDQSMWFSDGYGDFIRNVRSITLPPRPLYYKVHAGTLVIFKNSLLILNFN